MLHKHQIENFENSSRTRLRLLWNVFFSCEPEDGSYRNAILSCEPVFHMNPLTAPRTRWRRVRYVASIFIYTFWYIGYFCGTLYQLLSGSRQINMKLRIYCIIKIYGRIQRLPSSSARYIWNKENCFSPLESDKTCLLNFIQTSTDTLLESTQIRFLWNLTDILPE